MNINISVHCWFPLSHGFLPNSMCMMNLYLFVNPINPTTYLDLQINSIENIRSTLIMHENNQK